MRRFLSLVCLMLVVISLAACCGEGFAVRSPFEPAVARPQVVPTAWGVVQPAATYSVVQPVQMAPVQYAAPCAPAAAVPYSPGYTFAAPPAGCR